MKIDYQSVIKAGKGVVKFYVMHLCHFACICTGHREGCAIVNEGGALYRLFKWSLA